MHILLFIQNLNCKRNLGINVTVGVTSALVRVGISGIDLNGYPNTRLKDAGTLAGDSIAFVSNAVTPTLTLDPLFDWYWLVAVSGHTPTIKAVATTESYPILGFDNVGQQRRVLETGGQYPLPWEHYPQHLLPAEQSEPVQYLQFM